MGDIDWSVRRAMGADAGRCVTAADCYRAVQCGRACTRIMPACVVQVGRRCDLLHTV